MPSVYCLCFLVFSLPIYVLGNGDFSEREVLFDYDQRTRNAFNPADIQNGIYSVDVNDADGSAYQTARIVDRLIGNISESSDVRLIPASTGWKFFRISFGGHYNEIQVRSSSVELSYLYTNSTHLLPSSMAQFRRGNSVAGVGAMDLVNDYDIWEFPVRFIARKTGNGTFDFPPPYEDISEAPTLANNSYGHVTGDCSLDNDFQQINLGRFTTVKREDCMGVVGSLGDESRCWQADHDCRLESCEENCCISESPYSRNATCMWVQANPRQLRANVTFMDILESISYWSVDPPMGTGFSFQKISIPIKQQASLSNRNAEAETMNQLLRKSDAVESLLSEVVVNAESSTPTRPSAIDFALVCATVFSAMLAIDSARIYKFCSKIMRKLGKKRSSSVWQKALAVLSVTVISTLPALTPVAIIIYQEVSLGILSRKRFGSAWYAELVRDDPMGENVWWIRRVITEAHIFTSHGIRPVYILVPLVMLALDIGAEIFRVIRFRASTLPKQKAADEISLES
ncbi:hypothetical protein FGB62_22g910 [Gracilaria domingensis]|nr:hypothetical protein FGB62_22g910 [Gracilaria domingensis]